MALLKMPPLGFEWKEETDAWSITFDEINQ